MDSMASVVLEVCDFKEDLACILLHKIIEKTTKNIISPMDNKNYLKENYILFDWLLMFLEPNLAKYLKDIGFSPETYTTSWFLNLFSSKFNRIMFIIFTFIIFYSDIHHHKNFKNLGLNNSKPQIYSSFRSIDHDRLEAQTSNNVIERMFCFHSEFGRHH